VAAVSFVAYLAAGFIVTAATDYAVAALVTLGIGVALLALSVLAIYLIGKRKKA
jgi:hypothetical protein